MRCARLFALVVLTLMPEKMRSGRERATTWSVEVSVAPFASVTRSLIG